MADLVEEGVLITDEKGVLLEKEKIQIVSQADAFVRFHYHRKSRFKPGYFKRSFREVFSECWLDRTLQKSYIKVSPFQINADNFCYLTGENVPVSYLQENQK